jgi:hypothetical protein
MPNAEENLNLSRQSGTISELNDSLDTNPEMLRLLIIPDEVVLALGNIERTKSPDEAFFLF